MKADEGAGSPPADDVQALIRQAWATAQHAYVPYSSYPVGAALVTAAGRIYTGCNVENAAYPATICGERTALVKAISEGERHFRTIVVVTRNAGSPCGMCRQMLYEFAPELRVVLSTPQGEIAFDGPLKALLPLGFNYDSLHAPGKA
jgi:cytidine deaminase